MTIRGYVKYLKKELAEQREFLRKPDEGFKTYLHFLTLASEFPNLAHQPQKMLAFYYKVQKPFLSLRGASWKKWWQWVDRYGNY